MIYTENKQLVGKVNDVFGVMATPGIAVTPDANSGITGKSFKSGDKLYADPEQLRDKQFFLPRTAAPKSRRPLNQ